MLSPVETVALVAAGVAAGLVGTAGGITSSVSYPVLLAVGLLPPAADRAGRVHARRLALVQPSIGSPLGR